MVMMEEKIRVQIEKNARLTITKRELGLLCESLDQPHPNALLPSEQAINEKMETRSPLKTLDL